MYEDDSFVAFPDIRPAAEHHYLVITKARSIHVHGGRPEGGDNFGPGVGGGRILGRRGGDRL